MNKWEWREFEEREKVARDLWRIVKTSISNQAGSDNPFLAGTFAPMERVYPWLIEEEENTPAA